MTVNPAVNVIVIRHEVVGSFSVIIPTFKQIICCYETDEILFNTVYFLSTPVFWN